tara:strand:- start:2926 stop:3984 length:1059 start_codon:yes stop_codon:yes gene_type:complete
MATETCRSFKGFPAEKRKQLEQLDKEIIAQKAEGQNVVLPGQGGTELEEPLVTYEPTNVEVVLPTKASHWGRHRIVFGRDRHVREGLSGYGGRGCTAAGSIDIVVGSGGPEPTHGEIVGPNFFTDAARVYLTQRGDIDRYFGLPPDEANGISPAVNGSAVGIKADDVRIIGREGVRIFTNPRTKSSSGVGETTSRGGDIQSKNGIHLIANMDVGPVQVTPGDAGAVFTLLEAESYNKVQPMVKGQFLLNYLRDLNEDIQDFQNAVTNFITSQISFNTAIAAHTHVVASTGGVGVAVPDFQNLVPASLATNLSELQSAIKVLSSETNMKIISNYNWLKPTSSRFILSRYNTTN